MYGSMRFADSRQYSVDLCVTNYFSHMSAIVDLFYIMCQFFYEESFNLNFMKLIVHLHLNSEPKVNFSGNL